MATTTSSTGQVSRLQQTTERLRHETSQLRERLRSEHDAVRALRAQHAAELRAERSAARRRHVELEAQLQEKTKTAPNSTTVACEQCTRMKALHEAELRKLNMEFKKREQDLKAQLNEKFCTNTLVVSSCEQCAKYKAVHEAELRQINAEYKKKEQQFKVQLNEKNSTNPISSFSSCDQCAKVKALHEAEIRKLNAEFKKKEQQLKGQLNEKNISTLNVPVVAASCEQCAKFKAMHAAELRKVNVEFKKREQSLKGQLNELKKVATVENTDGEVCHTCQRLTADLAKQKEINKDLEERLQKAIDADRLKAADLRAQHEKHVTELSRITRGSRHDAHKLLEELKTKDRIIEQLRRSAGKARTKGEDAGNEHTQMRKLREEVRKNEQPALLPPACDPKPETVTHHDKFRQNEVELKLTIKQRDQMVCGAANEELTEHPETDTDSAVSSAPSSLSPQPCSPATSALRDRATPPPTSLSPQPSEGYTTPPPGLWPDLETYDDDGNSELSMARRQVRELERALLVTRATKSSSRHVTALSERVRQLEEREAELLRELGDLREQNELLEFRVLELAECPDKSSYSTSTWSVPEHRDVSTATDDVAERLNDDPVRTRIADICSRIDDLEDKKCLMQVLMLLHVLDEMSKRTEPYNSDAAIQIYNEREHSPPISLTSVRGTRDRSGPDRDRLVAKVPPFTGRTADSDDDRESPLRSHESSTSPVPVNSCATQTDVTETTAEEDSTKSLNLTAEVRKLDKLRETIDRNGRLVVSGTGCVGGCEEKHARQLEFYRERVDVLERKLCVYESSGELQARQLAERLSREVRLEAQVKQLNATVNKLQSENSRLEEERCELEEAENDTRLRCQRLEADILQLERSRMSAKRRARDNRQQAAYWESMVSKYEERNYELEEKECDLKYRLELMEKTAPAILMFNMWKMLQDDPKLDVAGVAIENLKRSSRGRSPVERSRSRSPRKNDSCSCDDRAHEKINKIKALEQQREANNCLCDDFDEKIKALEDERTKLINAKTDMEIKVRTLDTQLNDLKQSATCTTASSGPSQTSLMSGDFDLICAVQDLKERENHMRKRIEELEQREAAYMETLQQADEMWADMENGYKKRIADVEESEASMRDRLKRIEKHASCMCDELQDSERELAARAERLSRENSRLQAENKRLERELCQCLSQDDKIKELEATADKLSSELDRERRRSQALEQRLSDGDAALSEALQTHSAETEALRERLARTANELVHLEVTNGELREEVETLESKIADVERTARERVAADEKVIRSLSCELNARDKDLANIRQKNLAAQAGERLDNALQGVKSCNVCSTTVAPNLLETVEGVRTLCGIVSCSVDRPTDDAQSRAKICPVVCSKKSSSMFSESCSPACEVVSNQSDSEDVVFSTEVCMKFFTDKKSSSIHSSDACYPDTCEMLSSQSDAEDAMCSVEVYMEFYADKKSPTCNPDTCEILSYKSDTQGSKCSTKVCEKLFAAKKTPPCGPDTCEILSYKSDAQESTCSVCEKLLAAKRSRPCSPATCEILSYKSDAQDLTCSPKVCEKLIAAKKSRPCSPATCDALSNKSVTRELPCIPATCKVRKSGEVCLKEICEKLLSSKKSTTICDVCEIGAPKKIVLSQKSSGPSVVSKISSVEIDSSTTTSRKTSKSAILTSTTVSIESVEEMIDVPDLYIQDTISLKKAPIKICPVSVESISPTLISSLKGSKTTPEVAGSGITAVVSVELPSVKTVISTEVESVQLYPGTRSPSKITEDSACHKTSCEAPCSRTISAPVSTPETPEEIKSSHEKSRHSASSLTKSATPVSTPEKTKSPTIKTENSIRITSFEAPGSVTLDTIPEISIEIKSPSVSRVSSCPRVSYEMPRSITFDTTCTGSPLRSSVQSETKCTESTLRISVQSESKCPASPPRGSPSLKSRTSDKCAPECPAAIKSPSLKSEASNKCDPTCPAAIRSPSLKSGTSDKRDVERPSEIRSSSLKSGTSDKKDIERPSEIRSPSLKSGSSDKYDTESPSVIRTPSLLSGAIVKTDAMYPVEQTEGSHHSVEQFDLLTEVMVAGEPEYTAIEATVDMDKESEVEGVTVIASVTDSGNLELSTESPPGLIEHTMTYTPSGNMEIITGFTPRITKELDQLQGAEQLDSCTVISTVTTDKTDVEDSCVPSCGRVSFAEDSYVPSGTRVSFAEDSCPPSCDEKSDVSVSDRSHKCSEAGESLADLLKQVACSTEKIVEILDRSSEKTGKDDPSGITASIEPSEKSSKEISTISEKTETKSTMEKGDTSIITATEPSEKSSYEISIKSAIKSTVEPSAQSSKVVSYASQKTEISTKEIETISSAKDMNEDEESGCTVCFTTEVPVKTPPVKDTVEVTKEPEKVPEKPAAQPQLKPDSSICTCAARVNMYSQPQESQGLICVCTMYQNQQQQPQCVPPNMVQGSQGGFPPQQMMQSPMMQPPMMPPGMMPQQAMSPQFYQQYVPCPAYSSYSPYAYPGGGSMQFGGSQFPQMQQSLPPASQQMQGRCNAGCDPTCAGRPPPPPPKSLCDPACTGRPPLPPPTSLCDPACTGKPPPPLPTSLCDPTCTGKQPVSTHMQTEPSYKTPSQATNLCESRTCPPSFKDECLAHSCPAYEKMETQEPTHMENEPSLKTPSQTTNVCELRACPPANKEKCIEQSCPAYKGMEKQNITIKQEIIIESPKETESSSRSSNLCQLQSCPSYLESECISYSCPRYEGRTPSESAPSQSVPSQSAPSPLAPSPLAPSQAPSSMSNICQSHACPSQLDNECQLSTCPAYYDTESETNRQDELSMSAAGTYSVSVDISLEGPVSSKYLSESGGDSSPSAKASVKTVRTSQSKVTSIPTVYSPEIVTLKSSGRSKTSPTSSGSKIPVPVSPTRSLKSGSGFKSQDKVSSKHSENCTCSKCDTSKCKLSLRSVGSPIHTGQEDCTCKKCDISKCKRSHTSGDSSIRSGPKGAPISNIDETLTKEVVPHKIGLPCDCEECICGPCFDPKILAAKKSSEVSQSKHSATSQDSPIHTGEEDCTCKKCNTAKCKRSLTRVESPVHTGQEDCTCKKCNTAKCMRSLTTVGSPVHTGEKDCTCIKCNTSKCKRSLSSLPRNQDSPIHTGQKDCSCVLCKCNPCKDPKIPPYKRPDYESMYPANECYPQCLCDKCRCRNCIASKTSGIPLNRDGSPTETLSKQVLPHEIGLPCDCEKCVCDPCNDPKITASNTSKGTRFATSQDSSFHTGGKDCTCKKCTAVKCKRSLTSVGSPIHTGGKDCTCKKCNAIKCKHSLTGVESPIHTGEKDCTCRKCISSKCKRSLTNVPKSISEGSPTGSLTVEVIHNEKSQKSGSGSRSVRSQRSARSQHSTTNKSGQISSDSKSCGCTCDPCPGSQSSGRNVDSNSPESSVRRRSSNVTFDLPSHSFDCDCITCECPSEFTKETKEATYIMGPQASSTPKSTESSSYFSATSSSVKDISDCLCMGAGTQTRPTGVDAATCPFMKSIRVGDRSITIHYPVPSSDTRTVDVCSVGHPVECQCIQCFCGRCSQNTTSSKPDVTRKTTPAYLEPVELGNVTYDKSRGRTGVCLCDASTGMEDFNPDAESTTVDAAVCPFMKSVRICGRTIGICYPIAAPGYSGVTVCPIGHPVNCQCVQCTCNPCSKSDETTDSSTCPLMETIQLDGRNIDIQYPITSPTNRLVNVCPLGGHPVKCQCIQCTCNPCSKKPEPEIKIEMKEEKDKALKPTELGFVTYDRNQKEKKTEPTSAGPTTAGRYFKVTDFAKVTFERTEDMIDDPESCICSSSTPRSVPIPDSSQLATSPQVYKSRTYSEGKPRPYPTTLGTRHQFLEPSEFGSVTYDKTQELKSSSEPYISPQKAVRISETPAPTTTGITQGTISSQVNKEITIPCSKPVAGATGDDTVPCKYLEPTELGSVSYVVSSGTAIPDTAIPGTAIPGTALQLNTANIGPSPFNVSSQFLEPTEFGNVTYVKSPDRTSSQVVKSQAGPTTVGTSHQFLEPSEFGNITYVKGPDGTSSQVGKSQTGPTTVGTSNQFLEPSEFGNVTYVKGPDRTSSQVVKSQIGPSTVGTSLQFLEPTELGSVTYDSRAISSLVNKSISSPTTLITHQFLEPSEFGNVTYVKGPDGTSSQVVKSQTGPATIGTSNQFLEPSEFGNVTYVKGPDGTSSQVVKSQTGPATIGTSSQFLEPSEFGNVTYVKGPDGKTSQVVKSQTGPATIGTSNQFLEPSEFGNVTYVKGPDGTSSQVVKSQTGPTTIGTSNQFLEPSEFGNVTYVKGPNGTSSQVVKSQTGPATIGTSNQFLEPSEFGNVTYVKGPDGTLSQVVKSQTGPTTIGTSHQFLEPSEFGNVTYVKGPDGTLSQVVKSQAGPTTIGTSYQFLEPSEFGNVTYVKGPDGTTSQVVKSQTGPTTVGTSNQFLEPSEFGNVTYVKGPDGTSSQVKSQTGRTTFTSSLQFLEPTELGSVTYDSGAISSLVNKSISSPTTLITHQFLEPAEFGSVTYHKDGGATSSQVNQSKTGPTAFGTSQQFLEPTEFGNVTYEKGATSSQVNQSKTGSTTFGTSHQFLEPTEFGNVTYEKRATSSQVNQSRTGPTTFSTSHQFLEPAEFGNVTYEKDATTSSQVNQSKTGPTTFGTSHQFLEPTEFGNVTYEKSAVGMETEPSQSCPANEGMGTQEPTQATNLCETRSCPPAFKDDCLAHSCPAYKGMERQNITQEPSQTTNVCESRICPPDLKDECLAQSCPANEGMETQEPTQATNLCESRSCPPAFKDECLAHSCPAYKGMERQNITQEPTQTTNVCESRICPPDLKDECLAQSCPANEGMETQDPTQTTNMCESRTCPPFFKDECLAHSCPAYAGMETQEPKNKTSSPTTNMCESRTCPPFFKDDCIAHSCPTYEGMERRNITPLAQERDKDGHAASSQVNQSKTGSSAIGTSHQFLEPTEFGSVTYDKSKVAPSSQNNKGSTCPVTPDCPPCLQPSEFGTVTYDKSKRAPSSQVNQPKAGPSVFGTSHQFLEPSEFGNITYEKAATSSQVNQSRTSPSAVDTSRQFLEPTEFGSVTYDKSKFAPSSQNNKGSTCPVTPDCPPCLQPSEFGTVTYDKSKRAPSSQANQPKAGPSVFGTSHQFLEPSEFGSVTYDKSKVARSSQNIKGSTCPVKFDCPPCLQPSEFGTVTYDKSRGASSSQVSKTKSGATSLTPQFLNPSDFGTVTYDKSQSAISQGSRPKSAPNTFSSSQFLEPSEFGTVSYVKKQGAGATGDGAAQFLEPSEMGSVTYVKKPGEFDTCCCADHDTTPRHPLCDCPECTCNPCGSPSPQPAPDRLPASKLGPTFTKPCDCSSPGQKAEVRSMAVKGREDWRNLDTETLKQKLIDMENEARNRANEIGKIRNFINSLQVQCTCSKKETGSKSAMVESNSFEKTISGLQCALAFLQEKSRKKDRTIHALSDELKQRTGSCVLNMVLNKIAAEKDLSCSDSRQVMRTPAEKPCAPSVASQQKHHNQSLCPCEQQPVDSTPLAVTEVRQIAPDSLLLKWNRPVSSNIRGYEVEVNGEVKSRVHSAGRNATVLNGLRMDGMINLSVVAISNDGSRCKPSASTVYEPRPATPQPKKRGCPC